MGRHPKPKASPEVGSPLKPKGLSAQASIEWDRLIGEIHSAGIQITVAHRAAISLAATIAADIKSDWQELEREGSYTNSPKGGIMAHPAVKRMDALRRDYIKVLAVIGLRPGQASEGNEAVSLSDALNG